MERVCEELDEAKAEIEKLKAEHKIKTELSESLKRAHNEQLIKIKEANAKIQKQAQEISEKGDEISITKQMYEELKCSMSEKAAIIKHLSSANDKLRGNCDKKLRKWEEENRELVVALDVANSKNMDHEQKLHAYKEEVKGLKSLLSASEKKCLEAEKRSKESKKLRQRDDMLLKLEEENSKVEDQLKWKKEQFKHLQEAHEKLRGQLQASKKEWELEKSTLLDEISTLQTNLDCQTRISEGLQSRLQMCNQALAHEESRRKYLEVQLSETKTCFDSVFVECQEAKSIVECLTEQRDKDIASLRDLLGTKEMLHKEMEYRVGRLEQENQELRLSLKEFQEAQIQEAGTSSLSKIQNKLKRLEHVHRDCSKNLSAKEAAWSSKLEKLEVDLTDCRYELERKDTVIKDLKTELESCHSLIMHLQLQNEETSLVLLVLKSGILEARLKFANQMSDMDLTNSEREEKVSLLMKQLEIKSAALVKAQRNIEEDHEKMASLLSKIESLSLIEQQQLHLQDELQRHKELLKESSGCQLQLKEQALQMKSDLKKVHEEKVSLLMKQLEIKSAALVKAQRIIEEDHEKMTSLLSKIESLSLIEQQQLQLQDELQRHKEMLKESSGCQLQLKEQALQMKSDLKKVREALNRANDELAEKFCEGNELEFELQIWKSIAQRLKANLEESQQIRKQVELSLLAEVEVEVNLKQEKESLGHALEEKDRRIDDLQRQLVFLDQKLNIRETGNVSPASTESPLQSAKEKKKISDGLQKEIECLEQEWMRRELEGTILAHINAERTYEREKDNFLKLVEDRDQRIDDLRQLFLSSPTTTFSSQLAEKQAELDLLHGAWEKIATSEVLKEMEIQEKTLVFAELKEDFINLQKKLESHLSSSKEEREELAAELKVKQLEIRKLTSDLRTSDTMIDKLESESRTLVEDVKKLLSDRDSLLDFMGSLTERISEFSIEDMQLMRVWERIMQNFDNNGRGIDLKGDDDDLFDPLKENMNIHSSLTTKRVEATTDERSPLRALNN